MGRFIAIALVTLLASTSTSTAQLQAPLALTGPLQLGGPTGPLGPIGPGKTVARYEVFGDGCAGSQGGEGVILPRAQERQFGSHHDRETLTEPGTRIQQVLEASELQRTRVLFGLAFRCDQLFGCHPGRVGLRIHIGGTTRNAATLGLSRRWEENFDSGFSFEVYDGHMDLPERGEHSLDLEQFTPSIRFQRPFVFVVTPGRHLLVEIECRSNSAGRHVVDSVQQTEAPYTITTVVGEAAAKRPSEIRYGYGLVLRFLDPSAAPRPPVLHNMGRPQLGKSFGVFLSNARPNATAILLGGLSRVELPLVQSAEQTCMLLHSAEFALALRTDASGFAATTIPVPAASKLAGARFYQQFLVLDPGVPHGFALSGAGELQFGEI